MKSSPFSLRLGVENESVANSGNVLPFLVPPIHIAATKFLNQSSRAGNCSRLNPVKLDEGGCHGLMSPEFEQTSLQSSSRKTQMHDHPPRQHYPRCYARQKPNPPTYRNARPASEGFLPTCFKKNYCQLPALPMVKRFEFDRAGYWPVVQETHPYGRPL